MLRRELSLVGIFAAVAIMAACGGQAAPATGTASLQEKTEPGLTGPGITQERPTAAPTAMPSAATQLPALVHATTTPTQAVSVRLIETPIPPSPERQLPVPTDTPSTTNTTSEDSPEDIEAVRKIVKEYWMAFNDYDADRALPILEDGYRALEEELIRRDIGRMKLFRVKLVMSEESPPTLNDDGDYVAYVWLKTPIDSRRVRMVFRNIYGEWRIIFSGEAE